eukprot:383058-Prymnesium_polylepis.2
MAPPAAVGAAAAPPAVPQPLSLSSSLPPSCVSPSSLSPSGGPRLDESSEFRMSSRFGSDGGDGAAQQ